MWSENQHKVNFVMLGEHVIYMFSIYLVHNINKSSSSVLSAIFKIKSPVIKKKLKAGHQSRKKKGGIWSNHRA